jgi:heterodisulfide reductase subunit A
VRACPFEAPFINADGYSEIDPAKCLGCGICAAECPAKAIQLQGFLDDQIMGRTDALLEGVL